MEDLNNNHSTGCHGVIKTKKQRVLWTSARNFTLSLENPHKECHKVTWISLDTKTEDDKDHFAIRRDEEHH